MPELSEFVSFDHGDATEARKPVFIIAEAGVNHNGSLETALELVREAKKTGADCVKFQTFKAERVVTAEAPKAAYQLELTDRSESQLDMLKKLELSYEAYIEILAECERQDILFLSTPYSTDDTDFLEKLGVPAYKIASGQIIETSFLKGKPMILSTGMATIAEIENALQAIYETGNRDVVILQCTTNYPSTPEDSNISVIPKLKETFGVTVGYSDHTTTNIACIASVAVGAEVIEKHFTLDRTMEGPDHEASYNVEEFTRLVDDIRATEVAMGNPFKKPTPAEVKNAKGMRRSLVCKEPVKKGEVFTEDNVTFKRPFTGIRPDLVDQVIGKAAAADLAKDHILGWSDIV